MTKFATYGEFALILELRKGEEEALTEIVDRYYRLLMSFALRRLHEPETAKEMVHNMLADLWNEREDVPLDEGLEVYFFSTATEELLEYVQETGFSDEFEERLDEYMDEMESESEWEPEKTIYDLIEMEVAALPEEDRRKYKSFKNL